MVYHTNEVDAVIATHELADLFEKNNVDIPGLLAKYDEEEELKFDSTFDTDMTEISTSSGAFNNDFAKCYLANNC